MRYIFILFLFVMSSACGQIEKPVSAADTRHAQIATLNRTGEVHRKNKNKEKALYYHNQALQKARRYSLYEDQIRSLMGIAHVLKTDDADQSIVHLKNALQLADSIGQQRLSAEIYRSLSEIYRQQANYKQALQALEEHHRIADQLVQNDKDQKIVLLQKTYQRNVIFLVAIAIFVILIILFYDIRKTKKMNAKLHAANLIKDKLFTIIGHDLRNPIGSITDVLALMEHDELTADEQRHMISQMRKQGDVSLEILNSLLSWGQAQLNGITVQPVVFNPSKVITSNITALQGRAVEKSLEIQNQVPAGIQLTADQDHFDFVVRNLLSNAIKFSHDQSKITIAANTTESDQIVFSVKDEGVGISAAQQQAFLTDQLDVSFGTKGEKGTGIGLMLSKEFQKANGGAIWLESKTGEGTTFYFSYPNGSAMI